MFDIAISITINTGIIMEWHLFRRVCANQTYFHSWWKFTFSLLPSVGLWWLGQAMDSSWDPDWDCVTASVQLTQSQPHSSGTSSTISTRRPKLSERNRTRSEPNFSNYLVKSGRGKSSSLRPQNSLSSADFSLLKRFTGRSSRGKGISITVIESSSSRLLKRLAEGRK